MAVLPEFLQFVDPNSGVIHRLTFFGESFEIFDMMHCNMIFDTTWWSRVIFYCPMVSHGPGMPFLPWAVDDLASSSVALEVLICDDGSRDGSTEWLETLQSRVENQAGCDDVMRSTSLFEISGIFRSYQFCRFSRFCRFCLSMFSFRRWFLSCFRHSAAHFRPTNEHRPHTAHIGVGVVPLINFCCRVKTVTSCANPLVAFQSPFFFSL